MLRRSPSAYVDYLSDWYRYSALAGSETLRFSDSYPCLFDRITKTPFDSHYFYQNIWAFQKIKSSAVLRHVDVGSQVSFIGMLTAITRVTFIDIRPLVIPLNNFESVWGSVLSLPFTDSSISSLSCLHVAEHIGLGRYGDPLDPEGTKKATYELARVLAPQGNLYFSVPIGKPRVCFNAHRIHSPNQILDFFRDLELLQFSCIDDRGSFHQNSNAGHFGNSSYACGLFHFRKNP
jgi:hypothetical protein